VRVCVRWSPCGIGNIQTPAAIAASKCDSEVYVSPRHVGLTLMLMLRRPLGMRFKFLAHLVEQLREPGTRLRPWRHAAMRVVQDIVIPQLLRHTW
jgi:hypothetical protein